MYDGYDMRYRFFEFTGSRKTGVWPSSERVYVTQRFEGVHTHALSCKVGTNVCFGAQRRRSNPISYWGVGIDRQSRVFGLLLFLSIQRSSDYEGASSKLVISTMEVSMPTMVW